VSWLIYLIINYNKNHQKINSFYNKSHKSNIYTTILNNKWRYFYIIILLNKYRDYYNPANNQYNSWGNNCWDDNSKVNSWGNNCWDDNSKVNSWGNNCWDDNSNVNN
jgi:hypothetical protein